MTSCVLKIIACITMLIDHLSYGLFGKMTWLNYIGRLAFPIFAYQIVEGYTHTKDIKKYFFRLFCFALISQIPFYLFHSIVTEGFSLNVMFTLFFGLLCIFIWEKIPMKLASLYLIALISIIAEFLNTDYGYWGVLLIFVFYLCRNSKEAIAFSFAAMVLLRYIPRLIQYNFYNVYIYLLVGTLGAIIPILLYNGKQGKKIKYFLYIFYPAHLLCLYGLYQIIH